MSELNEQLDLCPFCGADVNADDEDHKADCYFTVQREGGNDRAAWNRRAAPAPQAAPSDLTDERLEQLAARFGIGPASGKMFGRAVINVVAVTQAAPSDTQMPFTAMELVKLWSEAEASATNHFPALFQYTKAIWQRAVLAAPSSPQQAQADAAPIKTWRERVKMMEYDTQSPAQQSIMRLQARDAEIADLRAAIAAATTSTEGR